MLVIPAIDLRAGHCVRLTQGRKDTEKVYDANPVRVAKAFAAAGAQMLHVVDLDGAFSEPDTRNREVLREVIRTLSVPVQFGGGLRSPKDVAQVIELGVTRVVVGTVAVESLDILKKMIDLVGNKQIVAGIDARNGVAMTHGWEKGESMSALTLALNVAALGIERVIYTDIQRDGMLIGPNVEQTRLIVGTGLKVTASGGISSLADLKAVSHCGVDSAIVGKALYEKRFTLEAALKFANELETSR